MQKKGKKKAKAKASKRVKKKARKGIDPSSYMYDMNDFTGH